MPSGRTSSSQSLLSPFPALQREPFEGLAMGYVHTPASSLIHRPLSLVGRQSKGGKQVTARVNEGGKSVAVLPSACPPRPETGQSGSMPDCIGNGNSTALAQALSRILTFTRG